MVKVVVKIDGVPDDIQAKCLFDFERNLRERSGLDVWVLKERMADDSKLRLMGQKRRREMSDEERNAL